MSERELKATIPLTERELDAVTRLVREQLRRIGTTTREAGPQRVLLRKILEKLDHASLTTQE